MIDIVEILMKAIITFFVVLVGLFQRFFPERPKATLEQITAEREARGMPPPNISAEYAVEIVSNDWMQLHGDSPKTIISYEIAHYVIRVTDMMPNILYRVDVYTGEFVRRAEFRR